jgi:hypothetical protein
MGYALCMLGNESYRHVLEICSTFSTGTVDTILRYTSVACPVHLIAERCSCKSHAEYFESLTFGNKSVRCQSYDSLCINKHFPMNGVTQMLPVPSGTPIQCVNGVVRRPTGLNSPNGTRCAIIHSFSSLSYDRSKASSSATSPHSAI